MSARLLALDARIGKRLAARRSGSILGTLAIAFVAAGCRPSSTANNPGDLARTAGDDGAITLCIGCQKSSLLLNLLRHNGRLASRLGPQVQVTWKEFPAGPQLLEAMNVGAVDFGHAGETPPIFAQAAGAEILYAACEQESPASEAILVRDESAIRSVADLQGKRIALNKGSNVHYFLLAALAKAGLSYSDVRPVFLPPADARAAFESGRVDAWAIWDPYYAAAEASGARALVDGVGLVGNRGFYLASRRLAQHHPQLLEAIVEELAQTSDWATNNRPATVEFIATNLGMDQQIIERSEARRKYGILSLDANVVAAQQRVAAAFLEVQLIPHPIDVAEAVWKAP